MRLRIKLHQVYYLLIALALLAAPSLGQVQPAPFAKPQYFTNSGQPVAGGCVFTYAAGTNTPLVSYADYLASVPNSNPVHLDASGRGNIFLGASAYRLVLKTAGGTNCSSGVQLWVTDIPPINSLLSSDNIFTGSNTFNGPTIFNGAVTFNVGFTSNGPVIIANGGSLAGTFTGNFTLSGLVNFSGGFTATTGTFSGQIISTVATGTPPFVLASSTEVPNLNAALLEGCDWNSPCPIGNTVPNTAVFTNLQANNVFQLAGGTIQTGTQGSDTKLLTAGDMTGATGNFLCKDTNGGATTGCTALPKQVQFMTYCASGCDVTGTPCTTTSSSFDSCTNTITWPTSWVDAKYAVTCSGVGPNDPAHGAGTLGRVAFNGVTTKTSNTVTVMTSTQGSVPVSWDEVDCQGMHR